MARKETGAVFVTSNLRVMLFVVSVTVEMSVVILLITRLSDAG